jgi:hypothetical protein
MVPSGGLTYSCGNKTHPFHGQKRQDRSLKEGTIQMLD